MNRLLRLLWVVAFLGAVVVVPGCAHPCGYMDLRAVMTPIEGPEWVSSETPDPPLRVVEEVSAENPVLRLRAERTERHSRLFRRELWGKRTYARYRWYAPLVKPITAVTVVGPLYFSFRDPHAHQGYPWRRRDYLRDVIAWYNPFSALPTGPRDFDAEDSLVRIEVVPWPYREVRVSDANRKVTLRRGGCDLDTRSSDEQGRVAFDLTPYLDTVSEEKGMTVELVTAGVTGEEAVQYYTVPPDAVP